MLRRKKISLKENVLLPGPAPFRKKGREKRRRHAQPGRLYPSEEARPFNSLSTT